jgi:hypothetical protein
MTGSEAVKPEVLPQMSDSVENNDPLAWVTAELRSWADQHRSGEVRIIFKRGEPRALDRIDRLLPSDAGPSLSTPPLCVCPKCSARMEKFADGRFRCGRCGMTWTPRDLHTLRHVLQKASRTTSEAQ